MSTRSLMEYAPRIYSGFVEYEALISAEDPLINAVESATENLRNDQFVMLATVEGIEQYESMLKIIADPTAETLQFRRERIINRLSFTSPFTIKTLRNKLNSILGEGRYDAYIDYPNYTIYVESSAEDQSWFNETLITMAQIKPANMIFINKPLVSSGVKMSEEVSHDIVRWQYRAGYWALGQKAFTSIENGGVVKMSALTSLKPELLRKVAQFTADEIKEVVLNGETTITEFTAKTISDTQCIIEYSVPVGLVTEVTSIALLDSAKNTLTSFAVYIPVIDDVIIKHTIDVKEG